MKKIFFVLAVLFTASVCEAQIFNAHKRALNKAEKKAVESIRGGADFVIDPIENVPVHRTSRNVSASSQSNWGLDLLLTAALRQRLVDECTYKVTVKVSDTGQPDHTALRQGLIQGKNYTTDADVLDGNGHSTHVCGIIASDQLGLCDALVDKGLLKYKPIKILSNSGSGSFDWVKNAVASERSEDQTFLSRGEFVVWNGSFGGGTGLIQTVEEELKKSTDLGVVFLFAAGNTGGSGVNYPGNGKYSIACASLDQSLIRSSYSTTGVEVWSGMPGRSINSTYKGQTYAMLSGTSMATPFLTAATAIAFSKWGPKLKGLDRVRAYLAWCAKDLLPAGKDNDTGWGLALIQNILDKDPANTPGLPPPPPPPPPPGGNLVSVSPLVITLTNEYDIYWDNLASSSAKPASVSTFKTGGRGSRTKNKSLALKVTKVSFTITFKSTGGAATEATRLQSSVSNYFKNRGFMILPQQDESWAAYWASYFLEMGLSQGEKWEVDIVSATIKTGGQTVTIKDLLHWPRT